MWVPMYNELVLFCQGSVLEKGVSLFVFLVEFESQVHVVDAHMVFPSAPFTDDN